MPRSEQFPFYESSIRDISVRKLRKSSNEPNDSSLTLPLPINWKFHKFEPNFWKSFICPDNSETRRPEILQPSAPWHRSSVRSYPRSRLPSKILTTVQEYNHPSVDHPKARNFESNPRPFTTIIQKSCNFQISCPNHRSKSQKNWKAKPADNTDDVRKIGVNRGSDPRLSNYASGSKRQSVDHKRRRPEQRQGDDREKRIAGYRVSVAGIKVPINGYTRDTRWPVPRQRAQRRH